MNKKRVMLQAVVALVVVSILGISIVSAGWFSDLFKTGKGDEDLEGELPASYNVNVQLANAPPTIVAFRAVSDVKSDGTDPGTTPGIGDVGAIGNDIVYAKVIFIVEDPNFIYPANDELPGIGTGPAISIGAAGNIEVKLTSPSDAANSIRCKAGSCRVRSAETGVMPTGVTSACVATSCNAQTGENPNCPCTSATNPGCSAVSPNAVGTNNILQVQYTCYVKMNYWDEPSVSPATASDDYWNISTARIKDKGGSEDIVMSGKTLHKGLYNFNKITCTGIGDCDYMDYLGTKAIDSTAAISWTGVSITVGNDPADTASDLGLTNKGNLAVASTKVKGKDLKGTNNPVAIMNVSAFSSSPSTNEAGSPPTECNVPTTAAQLIHNNDVTIAGVNIPFTAGGAADGGTVDVDNQYFCIYQILQTGCSPVGSCLTAPYDSAYKSDAGYANQWEITYV